MEVALQILFGMITLICFTIGANLCIKGVGYFLPENIPPQARLDNAFRFLSSMFFSLGFLLIWMIVNIETTNDIIYFVGVVVICAGLGRFYSRMQVGSAGKYFDFIMVVEIGIGISIILIQYFR